MNNLLFYIILFICINASAETITIDNELVSKKVELEFKKKNIKNNSKIFSLKNIEEKDVQVVIELPIDKIKKIIIKYINNHETSVDTFYQHTKISDRKYYDREIIFEYLIQKKSIANIHIEVELLEDKSKIDIYVWNKVAKINSTQNLEFSKGIFYGMLFLFTFICLILYALIRERNYLWFVIYLIFGTLYLLIKQNIAYEFLWSKYPEFDVFIKKIILVSYIVVTLHFLRLFILKRITEFILDKFVKQIVYIGILIIISTLSIGFFTEFIRNIFTVFQYLYVVICISIFIFSFIISYLKFDDKTMFYFLFSFILSFAFFIFYPVPTSSKYFSEDNLRQIFTYTNAFILALIISVTILYRVIELVKSNKQMRQQVSQLHAQKNYAAITAQMNEKKRVGKELHDGIGILMATTKMKISAKKNNTHTEQQKLAEIINDIDNITQKIRNISHELSPPTLQKFGLTIAIKDSIEHYNKENKIKYKLEIEPNLNEVSKYIIYYIIINLIKYLNNSDNYNVQLNIKNIRNNNQQHIEIEYSGNVVNKNNIYIKNINTIVELLHGEIYQELINTFTHKMKIELPIQKD